MQKDTNVTMYTTATCKYCQAEKEFFHENNIGFQEVRVDEDEAAARKMVELSGQMGVPFTVITKGDGAEERILGFDQPRLAAALGIA